jgi:hypothetical protein
VDVNGDLPTFQMASFGYGSRKSNPPPELRDRLAWRPAVAPREQFGRPAPARALGQPLAHNALARLYSGAALEALQAEAAEAAEQLRVDARRGAARALLSARADELASLKAAKDLCAQDRTRCRL